MSVGGSLPKSTSAALIPDSKFHLMNVPGFTLHSFGVTTGSPFAAREIFKVTVSASGHLSAEHGAVLSDVMLAM